MPVIPVLGGLRQENFYKLEASLGYNVNLIFKKETEKLHPRTTNLCI